MTAWVAGLVATWSVPLLAQQASGSFAIDLLDGPSAKADLTVDLGSDDEAIGDDAEAARDGYSPRHPFALGLRSGVWVQRAVEPGVGGYVRWRPLSWLGVEASTDHFFAVAQPGARRDHLLGADVFFPFIGDERFFVAPTAGASIDIRVTETEGPIAQETVQPLGGAHAGLMGEIYVIDGLAAFAAGKAGVLVGAAADMLLSEDAHVSGRVFVEPVGLVTMGASYYF